MAISSDIRRSGPFIGTGKETVFPFSFKIISADHVSVLVSTDGGVTEEALSPSAFTVSLNADQDNQPGGSVTLIEALGKDVRLSIVSAAPYLQPMVLTNRGGFYPETLNDSADNIVIQTQQLNERLSRAITVPATSDKTPEQLTAELLSAQEDARVQANAAAQSAEAAEKASSKVQAAVPAVEDARIKAVSDIAELRASSVEELDSTGDVNVTRINAAGTANVQSVWDAVSTATSQVRDEGDTQVDRIAIAGKAALTQNLHLCGEGKDTVAAAINSGSEYTLPEAIEYVVGFNHIRVSVNGVVLYPGLQYEEVGEESTVSTKIKLLMGLAEGDQVEVWVIPVGGNIDVETGVVTPDAGVSCSMQTWVVSTDTDAGATVTLPNQMRYVVGKNHLRMSWNGVVLIPDYDFSEIGASGNESGEIRFTFPLSVSDELNAWTVPYDHAKPDTVESRIDELESALADLSRKVVYKDESAAS